MSILSPSVDFALSLSVRCDDAGRQRNRIMFEWSLTHLLASSSILYICINLYRESGARDIGQSSIWCLGAFEKINCSRHGRDGMSAHRCKNSCVSVRERGKCAAAAASGAKPKTDSSQPSGARHSRGSRQQHQAESAFEIQICEWIADPQ